MTASSTTPTRPTFLGVALFIWAFGQSAFAQEVPRPVVEADYRSVDLAQAELGRLLFYDPILSGNQNISCATCHHPAFGTADGVSLGIGEGGVGLGPNRTLDPDNLPEQRIPRNAQALFNLGAKEFAVLFHDGRVAEDASRASGFRTPLDGDMAVGFTSVLSAQNMFPVLSPDEMAGHYCENDVACAVRQGRLTRPGGAWDILAKRVAGVPEYGAAFAGLSSDEDIDFADISNVIAAFVAYEWRSDTAPFDAVLRRQAVLVSLDANRGMELFYGAAGCSGCHSGPFLTDHEFHAMAEVQIGPGKVARFESHARDEGRFRVTGDPADRFAFRTPSLRNVALTAPYGHAGAYADLGQYIAAHGRPIAYDRGQAVLPAMDVEDWRILDDPAEVSAIAAAVDPLGKLSGEDILALLAFLELLSDPIVEYGRLGVPLQVPSGLVVEVPQVD